MTCRSIIRGVGAYLPPRVVSNDELARRVDTSDEWITRRTGIRQRHVAAGEDRTSGLAIRAGQAALADAGIDAATIDLVIVATASADHIFPATASAVQGGLGIPAGAAAFDVQVACSGFVYALVTADNMLRLGQARRALVIGAEIMTRLLDWNDRATCVLFGDGAGAVCLEAVDGADGAAADANRGLIASVLGGDGAFYDQLYVDGGVGSTGQSGHIRMAGREVFRHAVQRMTESVETVLARAGLTPGELRWLVPHQANLRIMTAVGEKLGIAEDRLVCTVDRYANTSAATIPMALAHGRQQKLFKPGDAMVLTAMGGGFGWGAVALRW